MTRPTANYGKRIGREMASTRGYLIGPHALITSVIAQAASDYFEAGSSDQASAHAYFSSPLYRHHLAWLELPTDWLPAGVQLNP